MSDTKVLCKWLKTEPYPVCTNPDSKFNGKNTSAHVCFQSDDYDCAWQYYTDYQPPKEKRNAGSGTTKGDT